MLSSAPPTPMPLPSGSSRRPVISAPPPSDSSRRSPWPHGVPTEGNPSVLCSRNLTGREAAMPIMYCPCHERLYDQQQHAWVTWCQEYVSMFHALSDLLSAAHITCADYEVRQTLCDRCAATAQQAADASLDPP